VARPPKWLENWAQKDVGKGVSDEILDRAFWLDDDCHDHAWLRALDAVDRRGDKAPLLKLLRSEAELTPTVRHYLTDLLERHNLRRRRGGQQTPAYDRSLREGRICLALAEVREYVQSGMRVSDAVEEAAKRHRLSVEQVANAYNGRRGSTRRIKQRARRSSP
jgi:hypothetical protein